MYDVTGGGVFLCIGNWGKVGIEEGRSESVGIEAELKGGL